MTKGQFNPMSASIFIEENVDEEIQWVLDEYLPVGGLVILAAKPKVGKTTIAYQLAIKVAKGEPFLQRSTTQGGVLVLALEEHSRDVRLRLKRLDGKLDNLYVHTGSLEPDRENMLAIETFAKEHGVNLIIVDTLAMFWRLDDETDASAMTKAIRPLLDLARATNACVLLIHHFRKSEGTGGDEIRGSIALHGAVDLAVGLYPDVSRNRRLLRLLGGRYQDTPVELIIELKDGEYVVIDPDRENALMEQARLVRALAEEPQDIDTLAKLAGVPKAKVYGHMKTLVESGMAHIQGEGVKGDPYRYTAVPDDSLSSSSLSIEGKEKENEALTVEEELVGQV